MLSRVLNRTCYHKEWKYGKMKERRLATEGANEKGEVKGWVRSVRKKGKNGPNFVMVGTGEAGTAGEVQVTLVEGTSAGQRELLSGIGPGSCVVARGNWISPYSETLVEPSETNENKKERELEVREASDWKVLGTCDASTYPLQKKAHSLEFLRQDIPHLRARTR